MKEYYVLTFVLLYFKHTVYVALQCNVLLMLYVLYKSI